LDRTLILFDIVSQGLVYGRLVSPTFTLSFIPEPIQYIRIDKNRDPGLTFLGDNRSSLAFTEVVFLQHLILFAHKLSAPLELPMFSRLLKNTHLLRSSRPLSLQRTTKYASLLRISRALRLSIFEQPRKTLSEAILRFISDQKLTYIKQFPVPGVFNRDCHRIIKYRGGMGELDAVIPYICSGLFYVPNNSHHIICILYVYVNLNRLAL
jgi:hypothetical protein